MYQEKEDLKKEIFGNHPDIKLTPDSSKKIKVWSLAFELGYSIAIPIVVFALIGRFIDKYLNTSPIFLLAGIIVSIFVSSFMILRKMKEIL
jgi:F0F1-type ATP synthase assembly protein I